MADDLQALLDRIKSEGIQKAETEAKAIVSAAQEKADAILKEARAEAELIRATAQRDADDSVVRGQATLRQAMRDVKLQLAEDLRKTALSFLDVDIKSALADPVIVSSWVKKAVEIAIQGGDRAIEVELGGTVASIATALRAEFAKEVAKKGVVVSDSPAFPNGFTLRSDGGRIEESFTEESIRVALARLLRAELAELLPQT